MRMSKPAWRKKGLSRGRVLAGGSVLPLASPASQLCPMWPLLQPDSWLCWPPGTWQEDSPRDTGQRPHWFFCAGQGVSWVWRGKGLPRTLDFPSFGASQNALSNVSMR